MLIKLTCRSKTEEIQIVEVDTNDPLTVLKERLNIQDNQTKFIFNGLTYMVDCNLTFKQIGLTSNANIFLNSPAISGSSL